MVAIGGDHQYYFHFFDEEMLASVLEKSEMECRFSVSRHRMP